MDGTGPPEAEELDVLRRRLYEPGATEADIAAYRDAADRDEAPMLQTGSVGAAVAGPAESEAEDGPEVVPMLRRRRAVLAGAGVVLIALVVVTFLQLRQIAGVTADPRPSTTTLAPTDGRIPASAAARGGFVGALDAGRPLDLIDYLSKHPGSPPPALRPMGRSQSKEYSGQATQTIELDPPALAERGGRVTVVLVLDRDASFSWQAERIDQADDRSGPVVPVASHAGSARAGEPTFATVSYTGGVPTGLEVLVGESVRWDAVVTFTD